MLLFILSIGYGEIKREMANADVTALPEMRVIVVLVLTQVIFWVT